MIVLENACAARGEAKALLQSWRWRELKGICPTKQKSFPTPTSDLGPGFSGGKSRIFTICQNAIGPASVFISDVGRGCRRPVHDRGADAVPASGWTWIVRPAFNETNVELADDNPTCMFVTLARHHAGDRHVLLASAGIRRPRARNGQSSRWPSRRAGCSVATVQNSRGCTYLAPVPLSLRTAFSKPARQRLDISAGAHSQLVSAVHLTRPLAIAVRQAGRDHSPAREGIAGDALWCCGGGLTRLPAFGTLVHKPAMK